jgi:hypothetical protein
MFQNNIVGKLFTITPSVLVDLELCEANTSAINQVVKHWNDRLGVWVKVHEGSVIDLTHSKIGNNVFFKAANVTRYHGFQALLETVSPRCVPHLRNNLAGARASVRDAKLRRLIQPSFSTVPSTQPQPAPALPSAIRTVHLKPHYASQAITDAIELSSDDEPRIWPKAAKGKERALTVDDETVIDISDSEDDRKHQVRHQTAQRAAKRAARQVTIDISDSEDDRKHQVRHQTSQRAAKRAAQQVIIHNASLTWHDDPVSAKSNVSKSKRLNGSDFKMEDGIDGDLPDYSSDQENITNSAFTPPSRLHKRLRSSDMDPSPPRHRLPSWTSFSPSRHLLAPILDTTVLRLPRFAATPSPEADSDHEEGPCQAGCCFSPMSRPAMLRGHRFSASPAYGLDSDHNDGTSLDGDSTEDEGAEDVVVKSWPGDFFVVDVIKGFAEIDAGLREKKPLQTLFEDFFGVNFKGTTYHDHRRRRAAASPESRQDALSLRRQLPDGLWSTFMRNNPAHNADRKARQRKLREDAKKGISSFRKLA